MIMHARHGRRPLSRGRRAALATLAGLPFLFAMLAVYRLVVTIPAPDELVALIALRAVAVLVMVVAMVGTIAIVSLTSQRLAEQAFARLCEMDATSTEPGRPRLERPA